jgi:hypothetical protein
VLIALAFMVWRNQRRIDRHSDVHGDELVQEVRTSPQHGYKDTYQHQSAAELESQAKVELESRPAPQELYGSSVVVIERSREA